MTLAEIRQRIEGEIRDIKGEIEYIKLKIRENVGLTFDEQLQYSYTRKIENLIIRLQVQEEKQKFLSEIEGEMNDSIDAVLNEQPSCPSSDWNPDGIDIDLETTRIALKQKLLGVGTDYRQQGSTKESGAKYTPDELIKVEHESPDAGKRQGVESGRGSGERETSVNDKPTGSLNQEEWTLDGTKACKIDDPDCEACQ